MSMQFFEKLIIPQGSIAYSTTFSSNNLRYILYDFVSQEFWPTLLKFDI